MSEIQIDFTDITMAETEGEFADVERLMKEDVGNEKWMIRTSASIISEYGVGSMVLHFYHDKSVKIYEYDASASNISYNPDIIAICTWAKEAGWNTPEPEPDLIRENKDFWKYYYDAFIVDSYYFDRTYGER